MASPGIDWLGMDVVEEILKKVDGTTLSRAGCVCNEFGLIARDDALWENACRSFCPPSALDPHLHHFISSSFGGFRKFYAQSFPFVLHKFYDDDSCPSLRNASVSPTSRDFVSIVDVQYKQKSMYSQVLWGIPDADDLHGWFCDCPFVIELLSFPCDWEEDAESRADCPAIAIDADALPSSSVSRIESEGENEKFWREEVMENMRLSWVVMNRRTKRAVNVSSWRALGGRRQHWGLGNDFGMRFGSILPPAHRNVFPGKAVQCMILMKCSICCDEGESRKLKINELSLQLRDMAGGHVNGKNSLLILEKATRCRRTTDRNEVLECYHRYFKARSDLTEQKIRTDGRFNTLLILTGIVVFATFWYLILGGKNVCTF